MYGFRLIPYLQGRTNLQVFAKQISEESIWIQERVSKRSIEKVA
jgi:hypothetical protein